MNTISILVREGGREGIGANSERGTGEREREDLDKEDVRLLHTIILKRAYNLRIMELDYLRVLSPPPPPSSAGQGFFTNQPTNLPPPFIENQKFRIRSVENYVAAK